MAFAHESSDAPSPETEVSHSTRGLDDDSGFSAPPRPPARYRFFIIFLGCSLLTHLAVLSTLVFFDWTPDSKAEVTEIPVELVSEEQAQKSGQKGGSGQADSENKGQAAAIKSQKDEASPAGKDSEQAGAKPGDSAKSPAGEAQAEKSPQAGKPSPRPDEQAKPEEQKPVAEKPADSKPDSKPEENKAAKAPPPQPPNKTQDAAQKDAAQKDAAQKDAAQKLQAEKEAVQKHTAAETPKPVEQKPQQISAQAQAAEQTQRQAALQAQQHPPAQPPAQQQTQPMPPPTANAAPVPPPTAAQVPPAPPVPSRIPTFLYQPNDRLSLAIPAPLPTDDGDAEPVSYKLVVFGQLERAKEYPETARQRHATGHVVVSFSVDDSGQPLNVSMIQSSGEADLDAEAVSMIVRAAPFPVPPAGAQRDFAVDIGFGGS